MRFPSRRLMLSLSIFCLGAAASLPAQTTGLMQTPVMHSVQPDNGKIGSVLRVNGIYLGKARVDQVFLTDHTFDMMCKILAQGEDYIEFRIPPSAKAGRLQLLLKTTGREPLLIEQPVYVTVADTTEAPKETLRASASATPSTATK